MEGSLVIKLEDNVWSMAFSPNGKKLTCGTCDGNILIYDVKNGTLILGPLKGHESLVSPVLWSCNGSRLSTASWDEVICGWSSDMGEQIRQPWTGHTHWIRSLSLSPDGLVLASASVSLDKTICFWDSTSGHLIRQHLQHDHPLFAIGFSPSCEFVASAGRDGNLYVWLTPWLNSIDNLVTTPSMYFGTGTYHVVGRSNGP